MDGAESRTTEVRDATAGWTGVDRGVVVVEAMPVDPGSPATGGLWRVRAGATPYFVKLMQHPRHWPGLIMVPEAFRADFAARFPWRFELDLALSPVGSMLEPPLRAVRLEHHHDLGDDRVLTWWEWVEQRPGPWSVTEYERLARGLGLLAGRRVVGSEGAARTVVMPELGPSDALRWFVEGKVLAADLPVLLDPTWWDHPRTVAAIGRSAVDPALPDRLRQAAGSIPSIMTALTRLPQALAHGDAGVQNILITERGPDGAELVVIDWGMGGPMPLGFDLGQLVVSGAHAGLLDPVAVPELYERVLEAYCRGLDDAGLDHDAAQVRWGSLGSLLLRSGFSSLPADPGTADPDLLAARLRLTEVLLDLTAEVLDRSGAPGHADAGPGDDGLTTVRP